MLCNTYRLWLERDQLRSASSILQARHESEWTPWLPKRKNIYVPNGNLQAKAGKGAVAAGQAGQGLRLNKFCMPSQ